MKIINKGIELVNIVGLQRKSTSKHYRWMSFTIQLPVDCGTLVHNVLTKEMIFLEQEEKSTLDVSDYLISHWYMVPDDFDEISFYTEILSLAKLLKKKDKNVCYYTIFTTSDCNARCFYCFEKGIKKYPMSKQVTADVAQYIIKHCGKHSVHIRWFGGEPLYNSESIDYICNALKDNGIHYVSTMISNGYLFDEKMIQKSVSLWNLKWIEITLDGTETVYNRTKSYIYKNVNAYQRVLNNIKMLVNTDIDLEIRLNVNSQNIKNLSDLVDILLKEFTGKNFYIHPRFLYENTGFRNDSKPEIKEMLCRACLDLEKKIQMNGFGLKSKLDSKLMINSCMADNDNAVGILPNGDLFKCEHFEGTIMGSIYNDTFDQSVLNKCSQRVKPIPECATCAYLPNCYLLNVCLSDLKKCNDYWKHTRLDRLKQQMLNTYNSYLKEQQITDDENDEIEIQC